MVALSELTNMFWGVTLDGDGKRYSQVVERSFHISMAALETSSKKGSSQDGSYVSVMIQHDKTEFLLCTLQHGRLLQQPLDLNFTEGEEVTFFLNGKGVVHLTGYLVEENASEDLDYGEQMASSEEEESEDYSSEEATPQLVKPAVTTEDSEDEDEDEDEEEEEAVHGKGKRKKKDVGSKKKAKKPKVEEPSDSEDDDDDDDDLDSDDLNFIDYEAEEDSEMDDDDDEELDTEDEEELARMSGSFLQPKAKSAKEKKSAKEMAKTASDMSGMKQKDKATPGSQKQTPGGQKQTAVSQKQTPGGQKQTPGGQKQTPGGQKQTPGGQKQTPGGQKQQTDSETTPTTTPEQERGDGGTEKKKKKKKKKKNKGESNQGTPADNQQSKPSTPSTGQKQTSDGVTAGSSQKASKAQKRVLDGGVICEEVREGHGPPAVPGKMVHVYYTGKLENGKIFDSTTGGKPFKFKLGKNEVIKGWDIGIKGMKVGGKRKLTVPAKMAYGKEKVGNIPPNSTLVFDVELKAVS